MAGYVSVGAHDYIGTLKLAVGQTAIHNGSFVAADWTAGTCATPTANTVIPYFVENVIDTVDEQMINDLDFTIAAGKRVRMKKMLPGEIFITTRITATPAVNDILDVGATGTLVATSGSPLQKFQVIRKPTLWGVTAYECLVLN